MDDYLQQMTSKSLKAWAKTLERVPEPDDDLDAHPQAKIVYAHYQAWCKERRYPCIAFWQFSNALGVPRYLRRGLSYYRTIRLPKP